MTNVAKSGRGLAESDPTPVAEQTTIAKKNRRFSTGHIKNEVSNIKEHAKTIFSSNPERNEEVKTKKGLPRIFSVIKKISSRPSSSSKANQTAKKELHLASKKKNKVTFTKAQQAQLEAQNEQLKSEKAPFEKEDLFDKAPLEKKGWFDKALSEKPFSEIADSLQNIEFRHVMQDSSLKIGEILTGLNTLEGQLIEAKAKNRYQSDDPQIIDLLAQVRDLRQQLTEEKKT